MNSVHFIKKKRGYIYEKKIIKLSVLLMSSLMLGTVFIPTTTALASTVKSSQENLILTNDEINAIKLEYSKNKDNNIRLDGGVSVTTKIVKKVLKKYGKSIANKVPGKAGVWLGKNVDKVIKGLDYVGSEARGGLTAVLKGLGLSKSTAELWADIIVTAIEWLV